MSTEPSPDSATPYVQPEIVVRPVSYVPRSSVPPRPVRGVKVSPPPHAGISVTSALLCFYGGNYGLSVVLLLALLETGETACLVGVTAKAVTFVAAGIMGVRYESRFEKARVLLVLGVAAVVVASVSLRLELAVANGMIEWVDENWWSIFLGIGLVYAFMGYALAWVSAAGVGFALAFLLAAIVFWRKGRASAGAVDSTLQTAASLAYQAPGCSGPGPGAPEATPVDR